MAAVAEVSLGSRLHLHPMQIHGDGGRGEFGPSTRPGGTGSSCIGEVGLKRTHGSGRVKFGPMRYLAAEVASALVKFSRDSVARASVEARWHRRV
eukprot:g34234.t1